MHQVVGRCPVCEGEMEVTSLHCPVCDSELSGRFSLGKFQRLRPDQLKFAELFIKCEGKIKDVEEEMGISYPTVRGRLRDLIRALGYEVAEEPATPAPDRQQVLDRRQQILNDLRERRITADEAARQLQGLPTPGR